MTRSKKAAYLAALEIVPWQRRDVAAEQAPPVAAETIPAAESPAVAAMAPSAAAAPKPAKPAAAKLAEAAVVAAAPREIPQNWEGLRAMVKDCTHCKLCKTRTNTVFGVGNSKAPLMVIGEGPGADEDAQGYPFVGRAGKLLDEMLRSIGRYRGEALPEKAVYIANVVKCRPPSNRDPEPDEVEACRPYLDQQIRLLKPKLIVALGRIAAQRLLSTDAALSKLRGPLYEYGPERTPVLISYHPAYLLRSPGEKAKSWQDLKRVHRYLLEH
jgi:DNA polymerase